MNPNKMTFHVEAGRVDTHGSLERCKHAEIALLSIPPIAF
jgi:hypothetical protein